MRGTREFCQRGPKFDSFFFILSLVDEGRADPNTTINSILTARQRNVIKMAFRWRADDGQTLNAGVEAL